MTNQPKVQIPINGDVICGDEKCGKSSHIIINPVIQAVTHIVVKDSNLPESNRRIVPIEKIKETTAESLTLNCTPEELAQMPPFTETHYIKPDNNTLAMLSLERYEETMLSDPFILPYVTPMVDIETIPVEQELIPPGELAVHRGAEVWATDGQVGRVDEFLVEPKRGHITHLIMKEGHLWMTKTIAIPLKAIEKMEEETVYLKLDKKAVESFPEINVKRSFF
ncbi:hypothetical protein PCC7424_4845 [Gloeothece citriformis PCC 7424]|uniref:PRC-barrel domain-containing protein n=1 Tax=Gloeothece citriformis (strain PCC 7424) TaxID=65393 RepID=B7KE84_GLOC7|nr:PRC-barrel domain-containing protein [Gloeothece citriformis]ACK73202.1 hypothetical protein PCC7424_4845 [Gloeothece citriformis PCC 7424]